MADVLHAAQTGSDLHEPKGVASATAGQAYLADGLGSGVWDVPSAIPIGDQVYVNEVADFPAPVAGVITLVANTTYTIVKDISTANTFVMGDNTVIQGLDELATTLTYSGANTLFTGFDVNVRIKSIKLNCEFGTLYAFSNTAGNEGTAIVVFQNVLSDSVKTMGTAVSLGILGFITCGFFNISTTGTACTGPGWNKIVAIATTFVQTAGITFDLNTTAFTSIQMAVLTASISVGATFIEGTTASGNIAAGGIGSISVSDFGTTGTVLTNVSEDDSRWLFVGNNRIADTRPDGLLSATGPTTVTITTVNVPVKVAGTWVVERTSQFTGTTSGRLTYNGEKTTTVPISVVASCEPVSGTNKAFTFYIAINGIVVANSRSSNKADSADPKSTTVFWQTALSQNDYVELWAENDTDNIDLIVNTAILRVN